MVNKGQIRILVVDDHAVVRKGLVMVLRLEPGFEVVGEADNGRQAIDLARKLRPDLVLLDLKMPGMDGEETALALKKEAPETRILILTGTEVDDGLTKMLAAGVDGYVLKDIEPDELAQAMRAVADGEAYLQPAVTRRVLDRLAIRPATSLEEEIPLTRRELEVLRWMATSATYRQIAEKLFVSEETVRSHAKHILKKLRQPNRTQTVLAAVRTGLIELPE
jgi:DNA-binding NarL/FixJ family response regulator